MHSAQSGEQNQNWPTSGQIGYITLDVKGILNRGTKSVVARKWADWLHSRCRRGGPQRFRVCNPYCLGGPQRFRMGDKIRSGPEVGALATSPLPSGGPPHLRARDKSEVTHKWADWLHNRYRLGGPQRCRAGSRVAHKWADWLHNPYRVGGSPTLWSGGHNQQSPTNGQIGSRILAN